MPLHRHSTTISSKLGWLAAIAMLALVASCASEPVPAIVEETPASVSQSAEVQLFDPAVVHTIEVEFDQGEYDALIAAYIDAGDKQWISATVTIDGTQYDDVGIRLKGNSSLFGLTEATSGNPEDLPWLIRLNEFVDGQDHQGHEELVIRSSSTETAMNEAVAQQLLDMVGLASQAPIATAFTVNGGATELRLAVEHPDEEWYAQHFDDDEGLLYKADSEGDYSYRGEDPEAYVDIFDQKVGEDDLEPLIGFLDFINNSDDEVFATELGDHLDVDAFATYLAFQDVIGNADDINGRGNNSYLQYDTESQTFTVVSWDLNLAFDTANVGRTGGGGRPGGGPGGGGPGDQPNVLVDRFMSDSDFAALYTAGVDELTTMLYSTGTVDAVLAQWTALLTTNAIELVAPSTVASEADAISSYVDGRR